MKIIPFPGIVTPDKIPFEQVYEKYYLEVLRYAQSKMGSFHDAEDLVGDSFFYCYQHYEQYDPAKSSITTWLYLIVNSRIKNYYRDRKEHVDYSELEEVLFSDEPDLDRAVYLEELRQYLSDALAMLPEKPRKAVILRYFHNKEFSEIANALDTTPGNIRVALSRALDKLEKKLSNTAADWRLS